MWQSISIRGSKDNSKFALLFLLLLSACQLREIELPQKIELPFETIEQREFSQYEPRDPGVMICSRREEVDNLGDLIKVDAKAQLRKLDYETSFALIVFQGRKPDDGYGVQIERAERDGNVVNIFARFQAPKPGLERHPIVTSPYHLIQARRIESAAQVITFNLIVDETLIVSVSHKIQ